MKIATRLITPALMLLAIGCRGSSDAAEEAAEAAVPAAESAPAPAPAPAMPGPMTFAVKGEGAGSAITGQTMVTPTATGFDLAVNLQSMPKGAHAWHIHQGACGTSDAPVVVAFSGEVGKPGLSTDLEADSSGVASQTVAVPSTMLSMDQLHAGAYSLHVHAKAGKDHGATIACANLK